MKLLDLFCGEGGAACGYYRAGFDDITGIDIKPMRRYPFKFVQANAILYLAALIASGKIEEYDLIHASPPCQAYSVTKSMAKSEYPKLVEIVRELLVQSGRPYVIENVPGAPLKNHVMLCGTMFDLRVIRHRLFETWPTIAISPAVCAHVGEASGVTHGTKKTLDNFAYLTITGHDMIVPEARKATGMHHGSQYGLSQCVPPAYTEWIGRTLTNICNERKSR